MASYQFINPLFKSITYHILSLPLAIRFVIPACTILCNLRHVRGQNNPSDAVQQGHRKIIIPSTGKLTSVVTSLDKGWRVINAGFSGHKLGSGHLKLALKNRQLPITDRAGLNRFVKDAY